MQQAGEPAGIDALYKRCGKPAVGKGVVGSGGQRGSSNTTLQVTS